MPNHKNMTFGLAKQISFAALLVALADGCATRDRFAPLTVLPGTGNNQAAFSRAERTIQNLFPTRYRATQRAIVTASGKQFTCDGLLEVSPAEGHHLAIVSSFGTVTDLRVKTDGGCELLKVTPLFREDWSRRFVARDLRRLFIAPADLLPAGKLADGGVVLRSPSDSTGVTAEYVFSADGSRWRELDLIRDEKIFYHATPKDFGIFPGFSAEIPGRFEVSAEAYQLELQITELLAPKPEVRR
jgi:hypothetical protein